MVDYSEWNDEKLLKEYRLGKDPRIVEILFTRYADVGFRVAMRFMHNEADAEDILQGAFIQFLRDLHQFREGVSVKPWLMKMIVNNCKDKCKEEKRRQNREQKVVSERFSQKTPESLEVKLEEGNTALQKKLRQSVDELPEIYRSPVWLILYEEFSYREVATVLALPEKTIRTQVARGLEKLREKLSSMGSLLSVALIVENISTSPLEVAPESIKKIIHFDKLNALAKAPIASQTISTTATKSFSFNWLFLTSITIVTLIGCLLYWENSSKHIENKPKNEPLVTENKLLNVYLDFNHKENIGNYGFLGEYNYLESGGIDNSGCLEIPSGFSLKIPIKDFKLPLKITCRSNIKPPIHGGIIGFTWLCWDSWEKMGQIYDVSAYPNNKPARGVYAAEKSEDWSTEVFYITENSIDAWIDNRRLNLYFVNQEKQNEFLYLLFYKCTKKVDDLVIETVPISQIPDTSEYRKIYNECNENTEKAKVMLKNLLQEKDLKNLDPKYHVYVKQSKDELLNQVKYKLLVNSTEN